MIYVVCMRLEMGCKVYGNTKEIHNRFDTSKHIGDQWSNKILLMRNIGQNKVQPNIYVIVLVSLMQKYSIFEKLYHVTWIQRYTNKSFYYSKCFTITILVGYINKLIQKVLQPWILVYEIYIGHSEYIFFYPKHMCNDRELWGVNRCDGTMIEIQTKKGISFNFLFQCSLDGFQFDYIKWS